MFVINCFGIEMVLCDLYLKTKGLLFGSFMSTAWYKLYRYDHSVLEFNHFHNQCALLCFIKLVL